MMYVFFIFLLTTVTVALAVSLLFQLSLYGASLIIKRNDIAPAGWAVGVVLVMMTFFFLLNNTIFQFKILVTCVLLWGIRLAYYSISRFCNDSKEVQPYATYRTQWVWFKTRSLFQIFALQGVITVAVMMPILAFIAAPGLTVMWKLVLGIGLWTIGFCLETISDWQLNEFHRRPARYKLKRGDFMNKGLWSISRHPNYLGEICMWWGIWFICLYTTNIAYVLVTLIGLVTLTAVLILMIRSKERYWTEQGNSEFIEYKKNTPVLIPGIPDAVWEDVLTKRSAKESK